MAALRMVIDVLAEQIEFLRYQLTQTPHMSQVLRGGSDVGNHTPMQPEEMPDGPLWLSDEEEDLLALKINDHISQSALEEIRSELRLPSLEPSE